MKVVIAIDSFKGSMSTYEAGNAAALGVKRVFFDAETVVSPIADGGEGSTEAIISSNNGIRKTVRVKNPIGEYIEAEYGIIPEGGTAVIEMAAAGGLPLISQEQRNPMNTTTYGVGEMIKDAIDSGCRRIIMGLGGSATNDGGVGMLSALGFEFLDKNGKPVEYGAKGLSEISTIRSDKVISELAECEFLVACDVENPLCGDNGCSAVYGPQKGADAEMVQTMDKAMANFEAMTRVFNPKADGNIPGSGAAGGLGFALLAYLNGTLKSGIELVIEQTGLEDKIKDADFVITGEGRLDAQSCMGKAPVGVASLAKKYAKPVFAFAGCVEEEAKACNLHGIDAFFPILKKPCSLAEAMDSGNAKSNLADTVEQAFRIVKCCR